MSEVVKEEPKKEKKRSVVGTIINIIIWLFVLFILFTGIMGFVNFNRIQKEQKPYFLVKEENYQEGKYSFEVHHFGIYKVVKQSDDTSYTYSIRLWFMDNALRK